ncbi:FYVE, RhoGEF and PH domain-containing protein 5 [Hypanus sabinus]|uniref:FYVE, RhoGEF and PH domain-containing protein 5 n=1 Tax=Hypanus sabinus TaxID=79690 RepID=UPI0028C3FC79|nr:FYVE, RhoGEF and PH domain-containing protein 5 [Hypanus sabinus]
MRLRRLLWYWYWDWDRPSGGTSTSCCEAAAQSKSGAERSRCLTPTCSPSSAGGEQLSSGEAAGVQGNGPVRRDSDREQTKGRSMEPDLKKPPLAPKPRPPDSQPLVTVPTVPLLLLSAPKALKPPIAPKPNLYNEVPEANLNARKGILSTYSNGSFLATNPVLAKGVEDPTYKSLGQTKDSAACNFFPAADDRSTLEAAATLCHENGSSMPDGYEDQIVPQDASAVMSQDRDLSNVDICGFSSAMPGKNLGNFRVQAIAGGAFPNKLDDCLCLKDELLYKGSGETTDNTEWCEWHSQDVSDVADSSGLGAGEEWHLSLTPATASASGEVEGLDEKKNGQKKGADGQEEGVDLPSEWLMEGVDGQREGSDYPSDMLKEDEDSPTDVLKEGANGQEEGADSPLDVLKEGVDGQEEGKEADKLEEGTDGQEEGADSSSDMLKEGMVGQKEELDSLLEKEIDRQEEEGADSIPDMLEEGADRLQEGVDGQKEGADSHSDILKEGLYRQIEGTDSSPDGPGEGASRQEENGEGQDGQEGLGEGPDRQEEEEDGAGKQEEEEDRAGKQEEEEKWPDGQEEEKPEPEPPDRQDDKADRQEEERADKQEKGAGGSPDWLEEGVNRQEVGADEWNEWADVASNRQEEEEADSSPDETDMLIYEALLPSAYRPAAPNSLDATASCTGNLEWVRELVGSPVIMSSEGRCRVGDKAKGSAIGEEASCVSEEDKMSVAHKSEEKLVGCVPGVEGWILETEGNEEGVERRVLTDVNAEDISSIAHRAIGFTSRVKCGTTLRRDTEADTLAGDNLSLVGDLAGKAVTEWKKARTRTQSLSAQVPETVPEETDLIPVEGQSSEKRQEPFENTMFAASHKYFMFYPRSYSVTGRELPVCADREMEGSLLEDSRLNRKEDNLSLPSVAVYDQRHIATSGASPPSSMLDIPAPFQLASITKKPITKSSPSVLVETDSPDKYFKQSTKKKSSFKRFLPIKLSLKKKIENRITVEVNVCKSVSEAARALDFDRRSLGNSPQLKARSGKMRKSDSSSAFLFYKDGKGKGMPRPFSRSVSRVESFEDRSRHSYTSLPLTKPRSISFPNTDSSDYENIPVVSSDYENIQIPPNRIGHLGTVTDFFEDPRRNFSSACENDGYVDMSSFTPLDNRQTSEQELESVDSEVLAVHQSNEEMASSEQTGNSSESEELTTQSNTEIKGYRIAKMMTASERAFVNLLQDLHLNFREVVTRIMDDSNGQLVIDQEGVTHTLHLINELRTVHHEILRELERSILEWDQTGPSLGCALSKYGLRLSIYFTYIEQFDNSIAFLEESCWKAPGISTAPLQSEVPVSECARVKQQLFRTLRQVSLYHHHLTDYLKYLCPDTTEYEDTKAVLVVVDEVCDQVRLSVKHGESFQKLLDIEYRVKGFHQGFQSDRMFIKEGRLLRLTDGAMQPRYCFLLSDMLLYTVPRRGGKCQLRKVLPLETLKVRKLCADTVENVLRIQGVHGSLTLCASSAQDCDNWVSALSTAVEDLRIVQLALALPEEPEVNSCLGSTAPVLIPASHVLMCMLCTVGFTLPWSRLHCNTCGKVVCRTCCRNKYPLGYLKGRLARVCDQCHKQLQRTGSQKEAVLQPPLAHSPTKRFSSMFNILHTPHSGKQRTKQVAWLETASSHEGVSMSGDLQRRKASRRQWKKLWFVIHDKVLYTYRSREDKVAAETLPLLGFTIKQWKDGESYAPSAEFQLYHKTSLYYSFKAEDIHTAQRWIEAMLDASVL